MRGQRRPKRENLPKRRRIEPAWQLWRCKRGFDSRSKYKSIAGFAIEQWADPDPVARQQQPLTSLVPQRDRELPVEAMQKVVAVLLIGMHQNLSVAVRRETVSLGLQLTSQLDVIENLAVKNHLYAAVFVAHGLGTTSDINNAQPGVTESNRTAEVLAATVRTAVPQTVGHRPQLSLLGRPAGSS